MLLETLSTGFKKVRSVNSTNNPYATKTLTNVEPLGDAATATGASVIELGSRAGGVAQNSMLVVPFAIGTDGQAFSFRVLGWRSGGTNTNTLFWFPVLLCEATATISASSAGATDMFLGATELCAKSISLVSGNNGVSCEVLSPATAGVLAHMVVSLKGFQKLEFNFTTGGVVSGCNALIAMM